MKKLPFLTKFLRTSDRAAGKPITFLIAVLFLLVWLIIGFFWGFTNTWLLIITSIATINASLMVFIIQNTQVREAKALNMKLDGLIEAIDVAENQLIEIEKLESEDLEKLKDTLKLKKRKKN